MKAAAKVVCLEAFAAAPHETLERLGYPPVAPGRPPLRLAMDEDEGEGESLAAAGPPAVPRALIPAPLRGIDARLVEAHGQSLAPDDPVLAAERRKRALAKAYADDTILLGALDDALDDALGDAFPDAFTGPVERRPAALHSHAATGVRPGGLPHPGPSAAPAPAVRALEAAPAQKPGGTPHLAPARAGSGLAAPAGTRPACAGSSLAAPRAVRGAAAPRTVVVHCHVFKNAGSSVDLILRRHFGPGWVTTEFPVHGAVSNADLTHAFIRGHPALQALSTHTGDWWLGHASDDLTVLPVIFLRHPLLRIRSAYSFERDQDADTLGARLAKTHDFAGYVAARLDIAHDHAFRNFQARRLAAYHARLKADLRTAALAGLERAPFVGLVEDFEGSARRLEATLAPHVPGFEAAAARANVTDTSGLAQDEKIARARAALGEALHARLVRENTVDFEIYARALERWPPASAASTDAPADSPVDPPVDAPATERPLAPSGAPRSTDPS